MRRANVVSRSSQTALSASDLSVLGSVSVVCRARATSASEPLDAAARRVVVSRRGSVALLFPVVAGDEQLENCGDDVEAAENTLAFVEVGQLYRRNLRSNDGDGKSSLVQKAHVGEMRSILKVDAPPAVTNGSLYVVGPRAAVYTVSGHDGDGDHGTAEQKVECYPEEGEE